VRVVSGSKFNLPQQFWEKCEHRRGRSFYGLRRQATDLAPEFSQDARVLNSISGQADSATREQAYQDKENERVRAGAAKTRRSMRRYLMAPTATEPDAIAA